VGSLLGHASTEVSPLKGFWKPSSNVSRLAVRSGHGEDRGH